MWPADVTRAWAAPAAGGAGAVTSSSVAVPGRGAGGRPLRVLQVASNLAPRAGGPPRAVLGLARGLVALGHHVTVYTTDLDGAQPLLRLRPHVVDQPTGRPTCVDGVEVWHFKTAFPSRWAVSPALGRALRAAVGGFDVVHIHSLYLFSTLAAVRAAHAASVPYIQCPHGALDPYLRLRRGRLRKGVYERLIERWNLDHAAAIHYVAEEEMRLVAPLGFRAPAVVVPVGVETEEFDARPPRGTFRSRYGLGDRTLVLFLGRLAVKKGLDLLAEAFIDVAGRFPDAHLVMVGPDEQGQAGRMRARLRDAGVDERVTFTGILTGTDRLAALGDADLWVLPSYTEACSVALLEAMACRLPVVISDRVNTWREVAAAGAGLAVPCEARPVAEAIGRLLSDPALRGEMGDRGRALVECCFTWRQAAERMAEVYRDVSERRPRVSR